ncbi:16S rRNA (guanine(527)-N(7))-methyltransferase RsmG [Treponema sp. OMZ 840]|uniref:16S rRNA (guanine(527)-N(7))-methyltransferase RsmG n=1 Tax=Treponema sp. OMZ 840 TaxID=244313 RepID=UPI003D8D5591
MNNQNSGMQAQVSNLLHKGLIQFGIDDSEAVIFAEKLGLYVKELELFNSVYDLTAAKNKEEIEVRHILDSLAARTELLKLKEAILKKKQTHKTTAEDMLSESAACKNTTSKKEDDFVIADIGTGGGLPGIPLAITMSDTNFVLVERMSKRCLFLENCAAVLGLKNVRIKNIEAERIAQNSFDIAVFRAFRPLDKKMLRILLRTLKEGGFLAAYKAKREKIDEEMGAVRQFVNNFEIIPLHVPFLEEHERNLVIIPKKN